MCPAYTLTSAPLEGPIVDLPKQNHDSDSSLMLLSDCPFLYFTTTEKLKTTEKRREKGRDVRRNVEKCPVPGVLPALPATRYRGYSRSEQGIQETSATARNSHGEGFNVPPLFVNE